MTRRPLVGALIGVVAALVLAACGSATPADNLTAETLPPEQVPAGISISIDPPVCARAGSSDLCQFQVSFLNGTSDTVDIDTTSTVVKDSLGTTYSGTMDDDSARITLDPNARKLVLWSVTLPYGVVPAEVVWVSDDGRVAKAIVPSRSASPTAEPSLTPSESPTPAPTPTETPTPTPTESATPTPTPSPTPTKTATPKPTPTKTRTASSTPPPDGSIG